MNDVTVSTDDNNENGYEMEYITGSIKKPENWLRFLVTQIFSYNHGYNRWESVKVLQQFCGCLDFTMDFTHIYYMICWG